MMSLSLLELWHHCYCIIASIGWSTRGCQSVLQVWRYYLRFHRPILIYGLIPIPIFHWYFYNTFIYFSYVIHFWHGKVLYYCNHYIAIVVIIINTCLLTFLWTKVLLIIDITEWKSKKKLSYKKISVCIKQNKLHTWFKFQHVWLQNAKYL